MNRISRLNENQENSGQALVLIFNEICRPFNRPGLTPDPYGLPRIDSDLLKYPNVIKRANLVGLFHYSHVMAGHDNPDIKTRQEFAALYPEMAREMLLLCPDKDTLQASHNLFDRMMEYSCNELSEIYADQKRRYQQQGDAANRIAGYTLLAAIRIKQEYEREQFIKAGSCNYACS